MYFTESIGNRTYHYEDGFWIKTEIKKNICRDHFDDDYIDEYISKNGTLGICDYCNTRKKVIPFDDFFRILSVGIDFLFERAVDSRNLNRDGIHGFDGDTFDYLELIYEDKLDLNIENEELQEDIIECIESDILCYKDEFGDESDSYKESWYNFTQIVKHQARFVFYFENTFDDFLYINPISILNIIQEDIINFGMIKTLSESTKIYRCVQISCKDEVKKDGKRIASNPSKNCLGSNRMSPAGISMFYGSDAAGTSIDEVVDFTDESKPWYSVAYFTPKEQLRLVDFTILPPYPSIFDRENNNKIHTISFLEQFVKDISKPITEKYSIEYVPTQIVTEYIKFNPELNVDGIIIPSSKRENTVNYILFMDHEQSLSKLKYHYRSKVTKNIKDK